MQAGVAKAEYAHTEDTQTWGAKTGSLRPGEPRRGSLDIEGFPDRGLQTPDRGSSDQRGLHTPNWGSPDQGFQDRGRQTGGDQTGDGQTGGSNAGGPDCIYQLNHIIRGRVMGQSWSLVLFILANMK